VNFIFAHLVGRSDVELKKDRNVDKCHREVNHDFGQNNKPVLGAIGVHFSWQAKKRDARNIAVKIITFILIENTLKFNTSTKKQEPVEILILCLYSFGYKVHTWETLFYLTVKILPKRLPYKVFVKVVKEAMQVADYSSS